MLKIVISSSENIIRKRVIFKKNKKNYAEDIFIGLRPGYYLTKLWQWKDFLNIKIDIWHIKAYTSNDYLCLVCYLT